MEQGGYIHEDKYSPEEEDNSYFWIMCIVFIIIVIVLIGFVIHRVSTSGGLDKKCSINADCAAGLICNSTTMTCRYQPGSACTTSDQCTSNSTCVSGVCVIKNTPITPPVTPGSTPGMAPGMTPGMAPGTVPSTMPFSEGTINIDWSSDSSSEECRDDSYKRKKRRTRTPRSRVPTIRSESGRTYEDSLSTTNI